jgi:hypothetical protein
MLGENGPAPKVIHVQNGLVRIPVTLITILAPATFGLYFSKGDLPSPREVSRTDKNEFILNEGQILGVETRDLGTGTGAVGNGMQPAIIKELLGRHIASAAIADMIQNGKFWGNFQMVTKEDDSNFTQWQLQFRPGVCPDHRGEGILRHGHIDVVCSVLRDNSDLVKVGGLWVHPKPNFAALQSNIILKQIQKEELDHKPSPIQRDDLGYYIEVNPQELTAAGVVPVGVTFQ